ncbi:MAG: nucleoside hydrolase [Acutalibacteraceae bacterium]
MTTKQIPVWIDCDTGTDDSVAIMLAHALPELSVVALSAVAGNSPSTTPSRTHGASCICWAPIIRSIPARSAPRAGTARGRQVPWRKRPRRCRAASAGLCA